MPPIISDDVLKSAGLTEREAAIEIACRLYAGQILAQPDAARLCGLPRAEFEAELTRRGLPLYTYTREALESDLAAVQALREGRAGRQ